MSNDTSGAISSFRGLARYLPLFGEGAPISFYTRARRRNRELSHVNQKSVSHSLDGIEGK